MMSPIVC